MRLSALLEEVPQQWHRAFVQFVETGDADQAFLDFLDHDGRAQAAIEKAFSAQANALHGLAGALRESVQTGQGISASTRSQADASKAVASAFEQVLALSNDDRRESLAAAAEAIAGVKDGSRARKLQVAASDFQEAVAKTAG